MTDERGDTTVERWTQLVEAGGHIWWKGEMTGGGGHNWWKGGCDGGRGDMTSGRGGRHDRWKGSHN
jgi:hypothetical protein